MVDPCMSAIKYKTKGLVCVAREQAGVSHEAEDPEPVIEGILAGSHQEGDVDSP